MLAHQHVRDDFSRPVQLVFRGSTCARLGHRREAGRASPRRHAATPMLLTLHNPAAQPTTGPNLDASQSSKSEIPANHLSSGQEE